MNLDDDIKQKFFLFNLKKNILQVEQNTMDGVATSNVPIIELLSVYNNFFRGFSLVFNFLQYAMVNILIKRILSDDIEFCDITFCFNKKNILLLRSFITIFLITLIMDFFVFIFCMKGMWTRRSYSVTCAGRLIPPTSSKFSNTTDWEIKNHLLVAFKLCTSEPGCLEKNCSKPGVCIVIASDIKENFELHVVGNLTHKIPQGKTGITIDQGTDYSGCSLSQHVVTTTNFIKLNSEDFIIDVQATEYLQKDEHHNTLLDSTLDSGKTLQETLTKL